MNITAKEFRLNLKKVLEEIKSGKEYTIIYRSRPVARLLPIADTKPNGERILKALHKLHKKALKQSYTEIVTKDLYENMIAEKHSRYFPESKK